MADFKFPCPRCGTTIECDELWSGHQLQCPACQGELVVPPKPAEAPHATLASATPTQPKLSIGSSVAHRSAAPPPAAPQAVTLQQKLNQARANRKSPALKWVVGGAVAVVCAVGGYFGYGYYAEWQAKRAEEAKQAATPPPPTNPAPDEAQAPKELPMAPAVWTLDLAQAKLPAGKANGAIGGTNFVVETAQFDQGGGTYLLRLMQGAAPTPDAEVKIYLHLEPTESPTGHVWTVSQEMKGKGVPQIVKVWKPNPKYAAQQKAFFSGYAMKLELGKIKDGALSGKIFLALPDKEQSVVAGAFKATTALTGEPAGVAATPTAQPAPAGVPTAASDAQRSAFERRYGKKP